MSDIGFNIEWWHLVLMAPIVGWPGLILGGIAGALLWRKRRIVGGLIAAFLGSLAWLLAAIFLR